MINKEQWKRFKRHQQAQVESTGGCYGCPLGEKYQVGEPLSQDLWPAYQHLDRFRDGKLWTDGFKPKQDSLPCQKCFEGWLDDMKHEGKICLRCGRWVTKKEFGMYIEEREAEGKRKGQLISRVAVCKKCLFGGKSPDEWARAMVEKARAMVE